MSAASDNLQSNQRQLDMDGCEVGVSRQALEETLDELARLREVEKAARVYYHNYCQDEANEEGVCELAQQRHAQELRDALAGVQ